MLGNKKAPLDTYAFDSSWFGYDPGFYCSGPSAWYSGDDCHEVSADSVHWLVGEFGTHPANPVGRNSMYGPGFQQWDINVQRSFKITERFGLDFRGELFNAFNHGQVDTGSYEGTTLIADIFTDAYNNFGTNVFANRDPNTTGHRHARLFFRVTF